MIYTLGERKPVLADSVFVAPTATLIGAVSIEKEASIWFNVVVRAENDEIRIGPGTNIQDGSVLHVDPGFPLRIGRQVTVGHKAILHGCRVGDLCLIGMNAVVLNGARIGNNCLIGANTLITERMEIPDGSVVLGSPGKIVRRIDEGELRKLEESAQHYVDTARRYRAHLQKFSG